jgi:hypothetical protein
MISVEESNYEPPPKQKEKTGTVRKRAGVPRGNTIGGRPQNTEMSNTNIILIVAIVVIVFVIAVIFLAANV